MVSQPLLSSLQFLRSLTSAINRLYSSLAFRSLPLYSLPSFAMANTQDKGYGYPYPAQGGYPPQGYPQSGYPPQGYPPQQQQFYQQGPVMPPPQYNQRPPARTGFLEGCLAALCCCCLLDDCCCDPTIFIN